MRKRFDNNGRKSFMYKKGQEGKTLTAAYRKALKSGKTMWDTDNKLTVYNTSTNRLNKYSKMFDKRFKKKTLKRKFSRL